jgi:hypothetical protein
MQLLRPNELPTDDAPLAFRYSRARALAGIVGAVVAVGLLVVVGARHHSGLAYYLAAVVLLALTLSRRRVLARFHFSNWLVRVEADGLFVNLRSYLNHHFPAADRTVLFIPYREIRSAREVSEEREVPDVESRTLSAVTTRRRRLIELELSADTSALGRALAEERARPAPSEKSWYGVSHTTYHHYPATLVSPTCLEIEWGATPVTVVFLDTIRRHVPVDAPVWRLKSYSRLAGLDREEQEERLRELAVAGQEIEAIKLARRLHGYDLAEARELVHRLRAEPPAVPRKRAG